MATLSCRQLRERSAQRLAHGFHCVGIVGIGTRADPFEIGTLVHRATPFNVGLSYKLLEKIIGRAHVPAVVCQNGERPIKVVEQEGASVNATLENGPEGTRVVVEVALQPAVDFNFGLLHTGNGGPAFHRAGTG